MFVTKKSLPRRTFLRGVGATLALPLLDSMVPALTALGQDGRRAAAPPGVRLRPARRDHGRVDAARAPAPASSCTPILKPLEPFRDSLVVVSNLAAPPEQRQPRAASGRWLTGASPEADGRPGFPRRDDDRSGGRASRSGRTRRFPSLEVATEDFTGLVGACDPGYSCAYMNTLNWQTPTTPLPMEINPRVVFERMFGGGDTARRAAGAHAHRPQHPRSRARPTWPICRARPRADRPRRGSTSISDHVREVERRIQRTEQQADTQLAVPGAPVGVPESFEEHVGADVRSAGAGLRGRPDARVHVHDGARGQPADVSAASASPSRITRSRTTATSRTRSPGTPRINTYHMQLFAKFLRAPAVDAGRRRVAARSLADRLRQRHEQRQRPHAVAAAARRSSGGRRARQGRPARRREGADADARTSCWASAPSSASRSTRFGVSTGRLEL